MSKDAQWIIFDEEVDSSQFVIMTHVTPVSDLWIMDGGWEEGMKLQKG